MDMNVFCTHLFFEGDPLNIHDAMSCSAAHDYLRKETDGEDEELVFMQWTGHNRTNNNSLQHDGPRRPIRTEETTMQGQLYGSLEGLQRTFAKACHYVSAKKN
ncbi:hypothetical protein DPMN_093660 [Dreissena polymorpha]|uniref:Uncharacterized protein n=1 Tax=Dreissena polymorpha TaxID=45954 RepID=A0A9D4L4K8_DREPO|nr:hypothetical protein DPMN_093660 [Dreissena polymorpha]